MDSTKLKKLFSEISKHRQEHGCGGYPYEHGEVLMRLVRENSAEKILEIGTGLGLSTIYLALGNEKAIVETIDQDNEHLEIAKKNWQELGVEDRITVYADKAEQTLTELKGQYDLIFFDGYAPQKKFMPYFEKLLKKDGLLVTANLFVRDPKGGRFLEWLRDEKKWRTELFADTAISMKIF